MVTYTGMGRRKTHGKKSVMLPVMVTVSMHARLKVRAAQEGRSMGSIIRELLDGYLGTEYSPERDVYDELSEKFDEMLS